MPYASLLTPGAIGYKPSYQQTLEAMRDGRWRQHELGQELIGLWLLTEGGGTQILNLASGMRAVESGSGISIPWRNSAKGIGIYPAGASSTYFLANDAGIALADLTLAAYFVSTDTPTAYERILDKDYSAGPALFRSGTTANQWQGAFAGTRSPNVTLTDGLIHHFAMTRSGTSAIAYGDGIQATTWTVSSANSDTSGLAIGTTPTGSTRFGGTVLWAALWAKSLSASLIAESASDPYAMLRAPIPYWGGWAALATGAQTVDLTGDGIASPAAFGTAKLNLNVKPSGIASPSALGSPTVAVGPITLSPSGIPSPFAFGTAKLGFTIYTPDPNIRGGLNNLRTVGVPSVSFPGLIQPSGIPSPAAFGVPSVAPGAVTLDALSIASPAAFGALIIFHKPRSPLSANVEKARTVKVLDNPVRKVVIQ